MNKYLFMIILGILIYSFINNKDGFSVGCIGWAILKNAEDVVPRRLPEIGSQNPDDYNYYHNILYNRDDIRSTFPNARQIYIFNNIDEMVSGTDDIQYFTNETDPINLAPEGSSGLQFQYYAGIREPGEQWSDPLIWSIQVNETGKRKSVCAASNLEEIEETLMIISVSLTVQILYELEQLNKIRIDKDVLSQKLYPFQRAITYTLQNYGIPLFYTASRFYYTLIHLLKNKDINNLTINKPNQDVTIGRATGWFGANSSANSSVDTSIFSVSTCLCDISAGESATHYYFKDNLYARVEIESPNSPDNTRTRDNVTNITRFIWDTLNSDPNAIPQTPEKSVLVQYLISRLTLNELMSRVLIILKPRDITNMADLFEQTVRITSKYGDFPRRSSYQDVIQLNKDLLNSKGPDSSTQARLLYTYERWEAIVFLTDRQKEIIDGFNIGDPSPIAIPPPSTRIKIPSKNRYINTHTDSMVATTIKIRHYMEEHSDIYYDATVVSINQPSEFTVSYTPDQVFDDDDYNSDPLTDRPIKYTAILNVNAGFRNGYNVRWKFNDDP